MHVCLVIVLLDAVPRVVEHNTGYRAQWKKLPLDARRKALAVASDATAVATDFANKAMEQNKALMRQEEKRLRAEAEQRLQREEQ